MASRPDRDLAAGHLRLDGLALQARRPPMRPRRLAMAAIKSFTTVFRTSRLRFVTTVLLDHAVIGDRLEGHRSKRWSDEENSKNAALLAGCGRI
mgnify:CR=1 FL=1